MLGHVVQGGHPACRQGHCHGLQVNDATLQHHKMLVGKVWVESGAWGSVWALEGLGGSCREGGFGFEVLRERMLRRVCMIYV